MLFEPVGAKVPVQPPDAVHDVALVELHVRVEEPPMATVVGLAVNTTVGTATAVTVTAAVAGALAPPAPEHTSEYEVLAVSAPVLCVPLVPSAPLQPPDAAHDVALVELHVRVAAAPAAILVGLTIKLAVGAGI